MQAPDRGRPTVVLLDALGTLVWLEPPAPRLQDELGRLGVEVTLDEAERAIRAEIAYYRAHLDLGRDAASLAELRGRCAEVVREALGASPRLAGVSPVALTRALLASLRFRAFPDAAPALEGWRARSARLVVASNWDRSLHEVLARLELTPRLDGVVTSAEAGSRKPDPGIFRAALALAGPPAGAERVVHVGDSLEEDVAGARAAGIEPVLLARDRRPGPPGVRTIASLAELDGLWP